MDRGENATQLVGFAPDVILPDDARDGGATTVDHLGAHRICKCYRSRRRGFVSDVSRPGDNATGFTKFETTMATKWLELLKDIAPSVEGSRSCSTQCLLSAHRFGFLLAFVRGFASRRLGMMSGIFHSVRDANEIARAADPLQANRTVALIVLPDTFNIVHTDLIIRITAQHRLPTIYPFQSYAVRGGLVSYGINNVESISACRILRRSHSQGREAGRFAGAAADEIRARHQSQDRQGARPRRAADAARPRRRGDRVKTARVHHAARRRGGGVAACGAGAAGGDAGCRICPRRVCLMRAESLRFARASTKPATSRAKT